MWHIDGHHSLICWRMVVHGGIDGYSRMMIYLSCSTNNRSLTVYRLFRKAREEYGVPSRVRSDKGGENILVCQLMISCRGLGQGSHIAGSSIHNQRIERLCTTRFFSYESSMKFMRFYLVVYGEMCTVVCAQLIMSFFLQWKQLVFLILTTKWI